MAPLASAIILPPCVLYVALAYREGASLRSWLPGALGFFRDKHRLAGIGRLELRVVGVGGHAGFRC